MNWKIYRINNSGVEKFLCEFKEAKSALYYTYQSSCVGNFIYSMRYGERGILVYLDLRDRMCKPHRFAKDEESGDGIKICDLSDYMNKIMEIHHDKHQDC